jgi:hypothetical protein
MQHTSNHNRHVIMYNHDLTNFIKNGFKLQIVKLVDLINKHVILHSFEWSQKLNLHFQLFQIMDTIHIDTCHIVKHFIGVWDVTISFDMVKLVQQLMFQLLSIHYNYQ